MNKGNLAVQEEQFDLNSNVTTENAKVLEIEPKVKKVEEVTNPGLIYNATKKVIDTLAGIIGVIFLIPIMLVVAIMRIAKKESNGPMFFEQIRIGKDGKPFRLYKFRTMVMNADEKLEEYLKENKEAAKEYKKYKKLKNDPRITKVGNFLRKTSLDEFPQFINVLKGDMSLVGPRPYLNREKKDIDEEYYEKIIKVKPGITGYWQVNGRSDVDFDERTYMDTYYIEHRSVIMDIKIILKTILKMFRKEGAI